MNILNILFYSIMLLIISFIVCICGYIFTRYFIYFKRNTSVLDLEAAMTALSLIINSEISEYEKNIFQNNRPITNSNFENYYNDITKKTIAAISPVLMRQLCVYITEDTIYKYIGRTVREYLVKKVNSSI